MKRFFLFAIALLMTHQTYAVGLVDVYKDALQNDQTYKQAEGTFFADKEVLPQARALLLPTLDATGGYGKTWQDNDLAGDIPGAGDTKAQGPTYHYGLNAKQALFSWGAFAGYRAAKAKATQAGATFVSAQQQLILRTAQAYFDVLQAEETLRYAEAQKVALQSELNVSKQRYKVGLDPITSLYQAQAAYDTAEAAYLAQQTNLINKKEDLRVITSKTYPSLNRLQYDFPLVSPNPSNIEVWTKSAVQQNMDLRAARFGVLAAQDTVHANEGQHFPDVNLVANYNKSDGPQAFGHLTQSVANVGVEGNFNILKGGAISSQVREAKGQYMAANAAMNLIYRKVVANSRKAYLGVTVGISQIQADRAAIKSNLNAVKSTEAGYKVGTQTVNDVLLQQQNLYKTQTLYAQDRFNYLLTTLQLKQAAGSLSMNDLAAIDQWLAESNEATLTQAPKVKN
jgi:outer membrane protein